MKNELAFVAIAIGLLSHTLPAMGATPQALTPDKAPWPPDGGQLIEAIVAIVNDEPITLSELSRAVAPFERAAKAAGETEDPMHRTKLVKEVLDGLVNDMLILEEAKKMKLESSATEVDAQVDRLKKQNSWDDITLGHALAQHGFATVTAYRGHLERELLRNQVISIKVASQVRIDENEVNRLYHAEIGKDGNFEERRAHHILLRLDQMTTPSPSIIEAKNNELRAMKVRVLAGEVTFEELARLHSEDSNAASGGDLGWFSKGELDPVFESTVFDLKKDEISEPVQTDFGLHLIKLVAVRRRGLNNEEEQENLMRQIRFRLREKELARLYLRWVNGLRSQTYVEIRGDLAGTE
jgi:parvulin-like peptidyl-prolyl isomerase